MNIEFMPYIPGGQGYVQSVLLPNYVPHSNIYATAFIAFSPELLTVSNQFAQYLTKYNTGALGISLLLAQRLTEIADITHPVEYAVGRVYGNREVFAPPILRQDGTVQLQFIETRNPSVRDLFVLWNNMIFDYSRGVSQYYYVPAMQATVYLYHFTPDMTSVLHKVTLYGVYPELLADADPIGFNVESNDIGRVSVNFKYTLAIPEIPPITDEIAPLLIQELYPTLNFSI